MSASRREVLRSGVLLFCSGCASMPGGRAVLEGASPFRGRGRACDHELCRYWQPVAGAAPPVEEDGFRVGRCGFGLGENL